jgi:hypothetical protein
MTGEIVWSQAGDGEPMDDMTAFEYLEKQQKYDPDLWILEIEDPQEKYQFDGHFL